MSVTDGVQLHSKSYRGIKRRQGLSVYNTWAASVSIFYEPQPNHRVGIIKHQLGYTATENILWRQWISEEGGLKRSSGPPQRSQEALSEESNIAVTLNTA